MSRTRNIILVLCVLPLFSAEAGERYKIDSGHSTIEFRLRHLFGSVKGRFTQFNGTLDLDRERPENSSVTVTIQTRSVDTANRTRDAHLCAELFACSQYPEIRFQSRSVKTIGEETADVTGDLTMRGVTRPILLHVNFLGPKSPANPPTTRWRVTTDSVKRSDFGLRWSSAVEAVSMIGNDVAVNITSEAKRER